MNQHLINYMDLILKNMKSNKEQYYEKHHVFPVGIFNDNDFLVDLSFIDHVKAHYYLYQYLLEKRGHDHRHTISAGRALYLMCNRSASLKSIDVNFIESLVPKVSVPHLPETKEKIKLALSGRKRPDFNYKHSDEAKEKIRKSKIGDLNPAYGKSISEETRTKMKNAQSGEKHWRFNTCKYPRTYINTNQNIIEENVCIGYMLKKYPNLKSSPMHRLHRGVTKKYKGWVLEPPANALRTS